MKTIEAVLEELDQIDEDDYKGFIDKVDENYELLIQTDNCNHEELEDVMYSLSSYCSLLDIEGQWTKLIKRRSEILNSISRLKGKSDDYDEFYYNIEYSYASVLYKSGKNLNENIKVYEKLLVKNSDDDEIKLKLRITKLRRRMKVYNVLWIFSLGFSFVFLIFRYISGPNPFRLYSDIGWGFFILFYLAGFIDRYLTSKNTQ